MPQTEDIDYRDISNEKINKTIDLGINPNMRIECNESRPRNIYIGKGYPD